MCRLVDKGREVGFERLSDEVEGEAYLSLLLGIVARAYLSNSCHVCRLLVPVRLRPLTLCCSIVDWSTWQHEADMHLRLSHV